MPATEQTWRNLKLMHFVFGISAVAMLIATVWMLAADHLREWKNYQRQFRRVETWAAAARVREQENSDYKQELKKREDALTAVQQQVPPKEKIDEFKQSVQDAWPADNQPDFSRLDSTYAELLEAQPEDRPALRRDLLDEMSKYVAQARFRENNALNNKKLAAANFDVARSSYEIAFGESRPQEEVQQLQDEVTRVRKEVEELTEKVQQTSTVRKHLDEIVLQITLDESLAKKQVEDQKQLVGRLETAYDERSANLGERLLELPIVDAFGRPLKVDQIWLPKLTLNNNFRDVARFDRCTTCHQAIDKTAPGSAVDPGYRHQELITLQLPTPAEAPKSPSDSTEDLEARLLEIYGMSLAQQGLIHDGDVTVDIVRPESPAAKAEFTMGDVIQQINEVVIDQRSDARDAALRYLVGGGVKWGQPLAVTIRRGLPNPYISHPRLDLYVGSLSPHKMQDIGCTICHEGQGSATDFKWASHMPTSPAQAAEWKREHGWFNNHHWIFPMNPQRFAESSCLKCHHDVAELEPSERFPDPPAPKLMAGYNLIRQNGCFGCHEINGFDGPNRRVGPDLRAEPNYAAAAAALLGTGQLTDEQQSWAEEVTRDPENNSTRRSLLQSLKGAVARNQNMGAQLGESAKEAVNAEGTDNAPKPQPLSDYAVKLVNVLEDIDVPGKLRKVGPSLRHVADKLDYDFLYSWVRRPQDFRPNTKMPQFFGLYKHLDHDSTEATQAWEQIEIQGVVEYLLDKSQKWEADDEDGGNLIKQSSAERGKHQFEVRGCLACHQHKDFADAKMNQGPDLSRIGDKLARAANEKGSRWLYNWLRDPSRYHPRTLMPNLLLERTEDESGNVSDTAADIAAYLLKSSDGWKPKEIPSRTLSDESQQNLDKVALEHLRAVFTKSQAEQYVKHGIPTARARELKGDEIELLGDNLNPAEVQRKKLVYVGRRTISKYGCSGCHDVPGFEDAKPIGTGLADWGRKGTDKLAFEQITQYLTHGHGTAAGSAGPHGDAAASEHATSADHADGNSAAHSSIGAHSLNYEDMDPSTGFFMEAVMNHERTGFIWQKLREPRSYDFKKTENKGYNERLRMPQFYFDQNQIESIITFVLGLVSEPPAAQYVYEGNPRRQAIANGLRIIEKYNCTGCHSFEMEQWKLAYGPDDFVDPAPIKDFEFLEPKVSDAQLAASKRKDSRGLMQATIKGMPTVNDQTGKPVRFDEDGAPIEDDDKESRAFYSFALYENAIINGHVRQSGVQNLLVPEDRIAGRYPALGGYLAHLIYPTVLADERKSNPNVKPEEAWGWLPPPLHDEGEKVQTSWLHDFLLDPYKIRPATVLRMPKFNMSSAEATALASYFAAVDNASYPYEFDQRTRRGHLASIEREYPQHLDDALKIVTDNNYCVKCHLIGDFEPTGSDRAKGPALDDVHKRLRPDFTHEWIANPKRILPYTGMPVNVPPDKPVSQDLYKGDSNEQLNAVVDLLMNFDRYAERQTSIRRLIKAPPPAAEGADQATGTQATDDRKSSPQSNERASLDVQNQSGAVRATR